MVGWMVLVSVAGAAPGPSDRERAQQALLPRHGSTDCAALVGELVEPVETLVWVAEHVEQPPWVGLRAAGCVATERAAEAQGDLERWVRSPEWRGLALIAVQSIDRMPPEVALSIAQVALAGPLHDQLRPRLARSQDPVLRGIAENATAAPASDEKSGSPALRPGE